MSDLQNHTPKAYDKLIHVEKMLSSVSNRLVGGGGHLYSKVDMMFVQENKQNGCCCCCCCLFVCFFTTVDVRMYIEKGVKNSIFLGGGGGKCVPKY